MHVNNRWIKCDIHPQAVPKQQTEAGREATNTDDEPTFHFAKGSVYLNFSRRDSVEWETEMLFYGECGWCAAHGQGTGKFGKTKRRQKKTNEKKVNIYLFTSAFIFCCRYCFFFLSRFPHRPTRFGFSRAPHMFEFDCIGNATLLAFQGLQNLMGCLFSLQHFSHMSKQRWCFLFLVIYIDFSLGLAGWLAHLPRHLSLSRVQTVFGFGWSV